jgi:hypothetical protein
LQKFEEHAEGRPGVDILPALAECRTEPNTAELNVRVREMAESDCNFGHPESKSRIE